jgi:hypothetical protein
MVQSEIAEPFEDLRKSEKYLDVDNVVCYKRAKYEIDLP